MDYEKNSTQKDFIPPAFKFVLSWLHFMIFFLWEDINICLFCSFIQHVALKLVITKHMICNMILHLKKILHSFYIVFLSK